MKAFVFILLFVGSTFFVSKAQSQQSPVTTDTTFKELIGKYTFPDGSAVEEVEVLLDSTGLSMTSDVGTSVLQQLGKDSFALVSFQGIVVFKRDEKNKIKAVIIDAMGYHLEGKKEEVAAVSNPSA
jgi:hypothetical protein